MLNLESAFGRDVVHDFVDEYARGRTPIPCVRCNTFTKFRDLVRRADAMDARWIATGHYARVVDGALHRGLDPTKDQSYFLFGLTQDQLSRTLFPLGNMSKPEVRDLAHQHGLALAEKPDSQEICFIPGGDYKRFIDAYLHEQGEELPDTSGELVTISGEVIGTHAGIHNFTVGQRKGLGVATGSPLYVIELRGDKQQVVVGGDHDLRSRTLRAHRLNWIAFDTLESCIRVKAKIRHRHEPAEAEVRMDGNRVAVTFDEPQRAITPGQAIVFYDENLVIGGGWIC